MGSVCSSIDDVGQPRSEVAGSEKKASVYVTAYSTNNTGDAVPESFSSDKSYSNPAYVDESVVAPSSKEDLGIGEPSGVSGDVEPKTAGNLPEEIGSKREDATPLLNNGVGLGQSDRSVDLVKEISDNGNTNNDIDNADTNLTDNTNNCSSDNNTDSNVTQLARAEVDSQVGVSRLEDLMDDDDGGDDSGMDEDDSPFDDDMTVDSKDSKRNSSNNASTMSTLGELAITKPAPDFECNALVDGSFKTVKLSSYRGKYVVLFFYPLDFTFVCPTEIIAFSDRIEEFRAVNCEVLACSTDSVYSHLAWCDTPRKQGGLGPMKIPLLADRTQEVSKKYGCLKADEGVAFRGLYIIDVKGNLRQVTINDLPVGRSVDETLRLVQAFQFTDTHGEVCPAGWKPGKDTMKPDPKESQKYFNKA